MTTRKKAKSSAKKKAVRTGTKKASSPVKKKTASRPARKKAMKRAGKDAVKKTITRRTRTAGMLLPEKEPQLVEPGPSAGGIPPVEEPASIEEAVGVVTHYYSDLGVAVVQLNKGAIRTNDRIRIKGHTTDLTQVVGSMEYEHQHVDRAEAGQCVGIRVFDHTREHDIVYLVK